MRLYTIEVNDKVYEAVENGNKKLVTLDSMGINVNDMNELIVCYDELRDSIEKALAANENAGMEAGDGQHMGDAQF